MTEEVLGTRTFTMEDQFAFGRLSSDLNPVHVDAEYARRSMFGGVLVHGVHSLMWALDRHVAMGGIPLRGVQAQFGKPVFLGEEISVSRLEDADATMLKLAADGVTLVTAAIGPGTHNPDVGISLRRRAWSDAPLPLRHEDAESREADLPHDVSEELLGRMFPDLCAAMGVRAAGTLTQLSRLVGMECPGRHSLFSGLAFNIEPDNGRASFTYRAGRARPAFVPVQMEFSGPDLTGSVSAFFRPPEVAQPRMSELKGSVAPDEFASTTSLVVGGSRGLGELTAKLIATGGGKVLITYAVGASDADRVIREIEDAGGRCRAFQFDVLDPDAGLSRITETGALVDAAYYFATPRITGRRKQPFEAAKLRAFERYYVEAFGNFCLALAVRSPGPVTVFYPSTVFIDEENRDNAEYAMAKSAGEELGARLTESGEVRVISRRLPRMATDQTSAIIKVKVENSVSVLLKCVREVNAAVRERK